MGSVKKNRTTPISWFFLKHFMILCGGALLIASCGIIGFNILLANNIVYRADYAEQQAKLAYDSIASAKKVTTDIIPEMCRYVTFDVSGGVQNGNMGERRIKSAWEAVQENVTGSAGNSFKVIPRSDGYCVLWFQIVPQYKSATLREYLPTPQNLIIVIISLLLILLTVVIAMRFGRALTRKLNPLILVSQKIQKQELDFTILSSDIREIDSVLSAMDKMRVALKESLQKQWQQEQLRKEQLSALVHDLKTPITVIRGNTDLLSDTGLSEEQKEYADYIQNSTLQMQEYVKILIEISKTDQAMPLLFVSVDLLVFLRDLKTQANGLVMSKQIKLLWQDVGISQKMTASPKLLSRALMNVLSNAVDFTPQNGEIAFTAKCTDSLVEFIICDNGTGFTATALANATTQFYMDDESRGSHLHYGMGLYITHTIVEQHHGTLELRNLQFTGGAEVIIRLPLAGC